MKTLVLIHGYSRSGKTTLLDELKAQGYQCLSTSQELDWIVIERWGLPRYFIQILRNKDDAALQDYMKTSFSCRGLKINTAEYDYIPKHGRKGLINRTIAEQYNPYDPTALVFFETIGGEEAQITKEIWKRYGDLTIDINLRGSRELKGVDIRQLSPLGRDIWNTYRDSTTLANNLIDALAIQASVG